jgi:hypothetical protein
MQQPDPSREVRDSDLQQLVDIITKGGPEADAAGAALTRHGPRSVPFLVEAYGRSRSWKARSALLFYVIPFARESEPAFELGLRAIHDRSYAVRYRACMILAYSLRRDALPDLERLREHSDHRTREDAEAAIDAVRNANHHYFIDRDHSERHFWVVNAGDQP